MQNFLNTVNSVVWGVPMLALLLFTALRFTLKSGFFQFRGFGRMLKATLGNALKNKKEGGISQWGAFCSVLGACIGTGNIVGVATAIYSGGAGTVFWMWVSAYLSMMTAYSENYLGIKHRKKNEQGKLEGGAFSYIENGLKMKGLSKCYAFFCLMSALGMGNLTQGNSVSAAIESGFGVSRVLTGVFMAVFCFLIIRSGVKSIAKFSSVAVPLMTVGYLILSFAVIYISRDMLLPCLALIFKEAFSLKSLKGYSVYTAVRYGIARGVFSNEAGLGSSTILHSQVETDNAEEQGMWAMLEVFIDTVFLCTITALVILLATNNNESGLFGAELSIKAYGILGEIGKKGISLLTAVFAFTSLTSCSFYGEKSFEYLFTEKHYKLYKALYICLVFVGSVTASKTVWTLADIFNGLMAVPNLFALNSLSKDISFPQKNHPRKNPRVICNTD